MGLDEEVDDVSGLHLIIKRKTPGFRKQLLRRIDNSRHHMIVDENLKSVKPRVLETSYRDSDETLYSSETNSLLKSLGIEEPTVIALTHSERIYSRLESKGKGPKGDYFKRVLKKYEFENSADYVAALEIVAESGMSNLDRIIEFGQDIQQIASNNYIALCDRLRNTREGPLKTNLMLRKGLINKYIYSKDSLDKTCVKTYH